MSFTDNGDGTATLAGTPAAGSTGSYPITIKATNTVASATQSFTLTVGTAPAITSADHATFALGSAGTFTVTTSGSPAPGLGETGSLPSGVSFTDNGDGTATLAGTPAPGTAGVYPITIKATNAVSSATQSFTLTIGSAPAITSADHATFVQGAAGSFTVTTTGNPAPALSRTGSLPSGVSFTDNGDGTATLTGTPAAGTAGSYPISIKATNAVASATQSFTLTVGIAPAITSADHATFAPGSAGTFTVTTSGSPAPGLGETGSLPSGITFVDNGDGTATLAGTPAAGTTGVYPISIQAANAVSAVTQSFTLTVGSAPAITSSDHATFIEGAAGSFTITTTGNPAAGLSKTGSLPSGVSFTDNGDGTATLAGTPAAGSTGSYPITIKATNAVSSATQSFTLTVNKPPAITSADHTTLTAGSAGNFTVTTSGNPAPGLSQTGTLPAGISFVDNGNGTATLAGTPSAGTGGSYPLTIKATNSVSTASQSFTLTVNQAPAITSANHASFVIERNSSFTITTTAHPTASLTETGTLPKGLSFTDRHDGTARLQGSSAHGRPGNYAITIHATNPLASTQQHFTITLRNPPTHSHPRLTLGPIGESGSTASFHARCSGPSGSCQLSLTLTAVEVLNNGKLSAAAQSSRPIKKTVVVGSTSVTIPAGTSVSINLSLNHTGKKLLASHNPLKTKLRITQSGSTIKRATVIFKTRAQNQDLDPKCACARAVAPTKTRSIAPSSASGRAPVLPTGSCRRPLTAIYAPSTYPQANESGQAREMEQLPR